MGVLIVNTSRAYSYSQISKGGRLARSSLITGLILAGSNPVFASEDLGIIQVESTTIDDKFEQKRDEPSNIGVVSGKTVDRSHTENIQQLLQSIPGVTTEVQSGESLKIHIRGIENQAYMGERPGVAVVIDGVPVFERTGRVNIDLDNIESIKVIKGGASYLFGDDALGGAVIITTKRGASQAGVKLATELGSFGAKKRLARAGYAGDNWSGHIQKSLRETDGYYDDSASESDYLNGKLQYYLDDQSDITFGFEQAERMKNSHGAVRGVTAAKEDPKSEDPDSEYSDYANHYDVELEKYFLTYSRDFRDTDNLMVNVYQYTDDTLYKSSPAPSDPDIYRYDNDYSQIQRGLKMEYRAGGEQVGWMAAADLRDNEYDNYVTFIDCTDMGAWAGCVVGDPSSDNFTEEKVKAVYGEVKVRLSEPLVMTLNGRYDQIDYDYTDTLDSDKDGNKVFKVPSYRLGMNYALQDNLDLYANASTGFRTPTARQLFVGISSPSQRVDPNPNLKAEKSVNLEIGLRTSTELFGEPLDLDVAVFQIERQDYINPSSGIYSTGTDNIYENVGDVRNRGLEMSIQSDQQRAFSWDLAYTYLNAKYTKYDDFNLQLEPIGGACPPGATPVTSGWPPSVTNCLVPYDNAGNHIPRTPEHKLNLIARYRPTPNWTVTGEMDASSSYYADEINQEEISGHTVFNLLVNYDRQLGRSKWSFFARVDNLFDKTYYNTARASGDGNDDGTYDAEDLSLVVNQGRTLTAGLSVSF
jgi:iron complex outermembrane recepter protein